MGAGLAGKASDLLMQPKSDGLLLMDVQHGPEEWAELLVWRVRHAVTTGRLPTVTWQSPLGTSLSGLVAVVSYMKCL